MLINITTNLKLDFPICYLRNLANIIFHVTSLLMLIFLISKRSFFSAIRAVPINMGSQHRFYSHNTFILQMNHLPELNKSNFLQYKPLYATFFTPNHLRRHHTICLYCLFLFTHSLASWVVSPFTLKHLRDKFS